MKIHKAKKMNDYVTDFYIASELVNDDLDLLSQIVILMREHEDKTRPNVIKTYCTYGKYDLLYKYTSKICDMPYDDFKKVKAKAEQRILQKFQKELNLFDNEESIL